MAPELSAAETADEAPPVVDSTRRWTLLAFILVGQFAVVSAMGSLNVALPVIEDELDASASDLQWTVVIYQLAYAMTLITGGRLGDMFGRRRMFSIGLVGFTLAALMCAVAPSVGVIIAARFIQGLAGGMSSPQVLALIRVVFNDRERARALSYFAVVSGSGFMLGQLIAGGLMRVDALGIGWRSSFVLAAALAVVALIGVMAVLPHAVRGPERRLDFRGAVMITAAAGLMLYPIINGRAMGWPPSLFLMLATSIVLSVAFVRHEMRIERTDGEPLVDLSLFERQVFRNGMLILLAFSSMAFPTWFVLTLTLQNGFAFDPLETSVALAVGPAMSISASALSPALAERLGRRIFTFAGALSALSVLLIMATFRFGSDPLTVGDLLLGVGLHGFANGLILPAAVNVTLSDVDEHNTGSASGLLQTVQQLVGAVAIAVYGIVFFTKLGTDTSGSAYVEALTVTMLFSIASCACVAAVARFLPPGVDAAVAPDLDAQSESAAV